MNLPARLFLATLILLFPLGASADEDRSRRPAHTLAGELVLQALGLIGTPYRYGGSDPGEGLDCSGLVRHVFRQAVGSELPRTAVEISRLGIPIHPDELQPGDLVFYNTLRQAFSHVGIYLGENRFVHAPASGGQVRIEHMDGRYWKSRFNGARRLMQAE